MPASTLLANDVALNVTLSILAVSPASRAGGMVVLSNDRISYTPSGNPATDSFTYTIGDGIGHTATGTVQVKIETATNSPTSSFIYLLHEPGTISLLSFGTPGQSYRLQCAPTLNGVWIDLATNTADANGFASRTDLSSQVGSAFYRTVSP